ncbi:MAG: hypothetical protein HY677_01505 [Chloroflexi bacterium]|nr:hypothetical protein [Chloroflexota bacterium]
MVDAVADAVVVMMAVAMEVGEAAVIGGAGARLGSFSPRAAAATLLLGDGDLSGQGETYHAASPRARTRSATTPAKKT